MKRLLVFAWLAWSIGSAQQKPVTRPQITPQEQEELESALAEAGTSPVEQLRAIEKHLQKYPNSPRKDQLERSAVRAAIDGKDLRRTVLYGERVLARQPDDLQMLEPVTQALLAGDAKEGLERALQYAQRYEGLVRKMPNTSRSGMSAVEWQNQTDRRVARAQIYEARATGKLGRPEEGLKLARQAFDTWPDADAAREIAEWSSRLGKLDDAVAALADAFTIADVANTDADRVRDRVRMGEIYRQAKGSEAGLGDLVLEAYDRNMALVRTRELRMRASDPNAGLASPMEFTLRGLDGTKLNLADLTGKVVVFDFWATWCVPCRAQHPLLAQLKERFATNSDVVFLSINADEDRALVKPFIDEVKWTDRVYFEDGLTRALRITTMPTTIVIDRRGQVCSRMNGYVPERFVETLGQRVTEALQD